MSSPSNNWVNDAVALEAYMDKLLSEKVEPAEDEEPPLYTDLSWILLPEDEWPVLPVPTFLEREDGLHLFYPAMVNILFGDPEAGKGLIATYTAAAALAAGQQVDWIDCDHNSPAKFVSLLKMMGAPIQRVADPKYFRHYVPDTGWALMATIEKIVELKTDLAVVDSVTEISSLMGVDPNNAVQMSVLLRRTVTALAESGACTLGIDHLNKDQPGQGRNDDSPGGSIAKKAATNGTMIRVDVVRQPAPGVEGLLALIGTKDRNGSVREKCTPANSTGRHFKAAMFSIDSTVAGELTVRVMVPKAAVGSDGKFRPTALMQAVSAFCATHSLTPQNITAIKNGVKGKNEWIISAVDLLVLDGFLQEELIGKNTIKYRFVKTYTEDMEEELAKAKKGDDED